MSEKKINGIFLEICANSPTAALAAQRAGASRVEFCQSLELGGTSPSYGQLKLARKALTIGLHVLIRPRGGDFLYNEQEFEEMKEDIAFCKEIGCDGVVIGILNKDGSVDKTRMQELVKLAKPMCVVFHRAFDRCNNPSQSLEDIIDLGCDRILTSGLQNTAWDGRDLLKELIAQANGRIEIMPGAGVNANNVKELIQYTGARSVHASAKDSKPSAMAYKQETVQGMDEDVVGTSYARVVELIEQIKSL